MSTKIPNLFRPGFFQANPAFDFKRLGSLQVQDRLFVRHRQLFDHLRHLPGNVQNLGAWRSFAVWFRTTAVPCFANRSSPPRAS